VRKYAFRAMQHGTMMVAVTGALAVTWIAYHFKVDSVPELGQEFRKIALVLREKLDTQFGQPVRVSCRVVSCRVVSCRVVSCRVVSCRVVSCRVVSCRVVSFP
jgi:hypothetical protein